MARLNALVIGNSNYQNGANLKNPINDADDIARVLADGGFTVTKLTDASFREMKRGIKDLQKAANDGGEVSLFFFAGHGVEVDGENYLIATDTEADDKTDVEAGALSLKEVITRLEPDGAAMRTNIVILDACRDNPFERKWRGKPRGLAPVYAPRGTLVAFATSPGQFAADGRGRNGEYTTALLKHIEEQDLPIEAMFKRVRNTLGAATKQKQISWEHTSLAGEFYFNISVAASIDDYSVSSIRDKIFVIDDSKFSHRVIRSLKTLNWYTQNPAVDALTVEKLNKIAADNLFVLGRNILQAASGSANSAAEFVVGFRERTNGTRAEKRKALLDGMLFEIFFNSDGDIRENPKTNFFNEVFDLEQFEEFRESFDFIASALVKNARHFFAVPGKGRTVTVDVQLESENAVSGIYVNGKNYLSFEADTLGLGESGPKTIYKAISREVFENQLSQQTLVPSRLLNAVYSGKRKGPANIKMPIDATINRP